MDVRWIHGSMSAKHNTDPDIQVYEHTPDTRILRQNKAVHYEAPFMYLLTGADRSVLIDTGATAEPEFFPLRATVDQLIGSSADLLVLHTHPHRDHTAGDVQFVGRSNTTVVGADIDQAWPFFGFDDAAAAVAPIDLGRRELDVIATPGHHDAAVTFYDHQAGWLLTGDTVYPGRLYVTDWNAFYDSICRLVDFCADRTVTQVLGCHIEMSSTPGIDYPTGTTYQPDELPLQLTVDHLHQIRKVLQDNDVRPGRYVLSELIICPD